ncbi:MAG: trypsin-like peptidase domain-containing protein [Candidatus Harrisonbacteria bacterium]|nr:trypsin-like peptidase domain-containing protein [Candidatus Harrisonbacteria bacterium]
MTESDFFKELHKKRYVIPGMILLAIFALFVGFLGARFFDAYQRAQKEQELLVQQQLEQHNQELEEIKIALGALIGENESVAEKIQEERERRLASDERANLASLQIAQLQTDLEEARVPNLIEIIAQWRPRVATVSCSWDLGNAIGKSYGSAVLFPNIGKNSQTGIVTNRHVLIYKNQVADFCTVQFPADSKSYVVEKNDIELPLDSSDWAMAALPSPSTYLHQLAGSGSKRCTQDPQLGDEIVILGYPRVGSRDDITATEGIISGFDRDFFITSAKVEQGNSGGAAVLAKDNCYLGIPTFVNFGQVEALARILNQDVIF